MAPSPPRNRGRAGGNESSSETFRTRAELNDDLWENDDADASDGGVDLGPRREGWLASWKRRRAKRRKSVPEAPSGGEDEGLLRSPLFLGLTGGLIVLCVLGLVFYLLIGRNRAQLLYDQASDAMRQGLYAQALSDFDRFLEAYPGNDAAPVARVQRGLCAVFRYTEGSSPSWVNGLREAGDVVSKVGDLPQFEPHRRRFGEVLGRIAVGLAEESRAKVDSETARDARRAMNLLQDAIPEDQRPEGVVARVEQILTEAQASLQRETDYTSAMAAMEQDLEAGEFLSVYERRRGLLRRWPALSGDEKVAGLIEKAQQREREAVEYVASATAAERTPRPQVYDAAITLVHMARKATGAPAARGGDGDVVYAQVADAIQAVRAGTGQVLWRRAVGYDHPFFPRSVTAGGRPATLLADSANQDLVAVDQNNGELVWRLAVGEPIPCAPQIIRNHLYQPLPSGRLLEVDLASGRLEGEFHLPQSLAVTPAADPAGRFLSVPAAKDTLYLLSLDERRCVASLFLGHGEGSLSAPMVNAGPYQVLAENDRADSSQLRVILASGADATLREAQSQRLAGWVHFAPILRANRLFVTTDRGRLYAFSLAARETSQPLVLDGQTGEATEMGGQPLVVPRTDREAWLLGNRFEQWMLNEPQQRFEGVRRPGSTENAPGEVLQRLTFSSWQPAQIVGNDAYLVTQSSGRAGWQMTAISLNDDAVRWQIVLGSGLADLTVADSQDVMVALTRSGDLFRIAAGGATGSRVLQDPFSTFAGSEGLQGRIWHADVNPTLRVYWSDRAPRQLLVRQGTATGQSMSLTARTLPTALQAPPALFANGLLAPEPDGQLAWLDLSGLVPQTQAFQAPFDVTRPPHWQGVVAASDGSILSADLHGGLYRLDVADDPVRHLRGETVRTFADPLRSRLATVGGAVYVVDGNQTLWALSPDGREELGRFPLPGGLAGDLMTVGDYLFVREPSGTLHCFDGAGREAWHSSLDMGPLAGAAAISGDLVLLASTEGTVTALKLADGDRAWEFETGQSLETGPSPIGNRLVVGTADGTLLLYPFPTQ